MKSANPPRLAVWLLEEFGPKVNQEALAGDLNEGFRLGRSKAWYWRQVLAAIRWRGELFRLLLLTGMSWYLTWPALGGHPSPVSRSLDIAIIAAGFLACRCLPGMLRGRQRVALAMMIVAFFCLLFRYNSEMAWHYETMGTILVVLLVFNGKQLPSPAHDLTGRVLRYGDAREETERLAAKLHLEMMLETDPELRRAFKEAIATVRRLRGQGAKEME